VPKHCILKGADHPRIDGVKDQEMKQRLVVGCEWTFNEALS
jgi:hypothetical protein